MITGRDRYLFTDAEAQPQHNFEYVAIRNLFNDREIYDNYPAFQRGNVWPQKFKRALIDSILRGDPIHPIFVYKIVDEEGRERYYILDGHQRLSTIYEFMTNRFATWTIARAKSEEPNSLLPIEPGRYFNELSDRAKNLFASYKFIIDIVDGSDKTKLGLVFRRIQHQLPLKMAEKLASYNSKAMDYAFQLQEHPIWNTLYLGPNTNKETLQGSLGLIVLEMRQGYAELTGGRLRQYASGSKDDLITTDLRGRIEARLEIVMHVFAGAAFTYRTEIVPMYQAIMFLEEQGHKFTSSDYGALTSWFGHVLQRAKQGGKHGYTYPLAKLGELNKQHEFWEIYHLSELIEQLKANRTNVE